jgi:hypothetical protein
MQHSIGPRIADMPLLAIFGYGLAFWFTLPLVRVLPHLDGSDPADCLDL